MSAADLRIAVLGAGRAGGALFQALASTGAAPILWSRRPETAAAARADGFPATTGPLPSVDGFDLVVLAISDPAVEPLAAGLSAAPMRSRPLLAHLAGALDLQCLDAWRRAGGEVGSFHPIASIADRRAVLRGAVAVDASGPAARQLLDGLAARLGLTAIHPTGDRARYHAAASFAGNFPQVLLEAALRLLAECGLTSDEAQAAFGPLLESAAHNAATLGPAGGLSGPVARGDVEVVARHLAAVASNPELGALYRAATRIAIDLAAARGAPRIDELRRLIGEAPPAE